MQTQRVECPPRGREDRVLCSDAKNLHDIYSNERISLAVNRQSAEHLMSALSAHSLVNAALEVGDLLTGQLVARRNIERV